VFTPGAGVKEGVNIPPWGQISPLGARGEVKNGTLLIYSTCSVEVHQLSQEARFVAAHTLSNNLSQKFPSFKKLGDFKANKNIFATRNDLDFVLSDQQFDNSLLKNRPSAFQISSQKPFKIKKFPFYNFC
jgi:hypothetical protein